jgi:actin-related protein
VEKKQAKRIEIDHISFEYPLSSEDRRKYEKISDRTRPYPGGLHEQQSHKKSSRKTNHVKSSVHALQSMPQNYDTKKTQQKMTGCQS